MWRGRLPENGEKKERSGEKGERRSRARCRASGREMGGKRLLWECEESKKGKRNNPHPPNPPLLRLTRNKELD